MGRGGSAGKLAARVRLILTYPAAEPYFRRGDLDGAREMVAERAYVYPRWSAADTWIIDLHSRAVDPLGGAEFIRVKCRAEGLDEAKTLEVWERVMLVDRIARQWKADTDEYNAARGVWVNG